MLCMVACCVDCTRLTATGWAAMLCWQTGLFFWTAGLGLPASAGLKPGAPFDACRWQSVPALTAPRIFSDK